MSFSSFHGNSDTVRQIRDMLARKRFPHGVVLAGPAGSGKYTLATMVARAMNCLEQPITDGLPDYCGKCSNCLRIGQLEDLDSRVAEALEARDGLKETEKKETRLFIQTHPDVLVIPPDPPQMMIKVDQVRRVIQSIYFRPAEARERVFIFTDAAFMKEAANALLKVLEEPPEYATILLLARNPGELLPTIRSRCVTFTLSALPAEEIEQYLARKHPEWSARQRQLVARLSGGAVGRALSLDLDQYTAARKDALALLSKAAHPASDSDHSALFRVTETYRAGADGKEKTEQLLAAVYSLLKDVMALTSGSPELVRNTDIAAELKSLAAGVDFNWIAQATQQLGQVQSGMRRNVLRPLSLDAFALALE